MDDKFKISIFHALIEGQTSNEICREFHISNAELKKVMEEYELIKQQFEQMKSPEEISTELGLSLDYIETVRDLEHTGAGTTPPQIEEQEEIPESEDKEKPEIEEEDPEQKPKTKRNSKPKSTKDLAQKMAKSGEGETADVLLKDAGEIAKSLALERQEIGKLVQEYVGTIAAQYGYTNYQAFLEHLLNFWIENQGKIKEMEEEIAQYVELVNQQNEILETDMVRVSIVKSIENITYAAIMGGATLDERFMDILEAYKHLLIIDPTTIPIKKANRPQSQSQQQPQIQNNNISNTMTEMNY